MESHECGFPLYWWAISWSAGKKESSVCSKGGNEYGYKINIKVSGKIEGATSETTAHSNSIMIKNVLKNKKEKREIKKINEI